MKRLCLTLAFVLLVSCSGTPRSVTPLGVAPLDPNGQAVQQHAARPSPSVEADAALSAIRPQGRISSSCSGGQYVDTSKGWMYARVVGSWSGPLSASGCDVGVYVPATMNGARIENATISDANGFGVFVDGAIAVTIRYVNITRIGGHGSQPNCGFPDSGTGPYTPNGCQKGVGVYFSGGSGGLTSVFLTHYQKNGVAIRNGAAVSIVFSSATGEGPVNYIAQNGFEYVDAIVTGFLDNETRGNFYIPTSYTAAGVLMICSAGVIPGLIQAANISVNNNINYDLEGCGG